MKQNISPRKWLCYLDKLYKWSSNNMVVLFKVISLKVDEMFISIGLVICYFAIVPRTCG